ncbi:MAG: hypothetical protein GF313_09615 [Caldithrix sp.]|nr:hypothetical protein [Caldithrix sp.]
MRRVILLLAAVIILSGTPAMAQNFGLFSVSPYVSIVMPEDHDMGFGVGVSADVGEITPGLTLVPNVYFWNASWEAFEDGSTTNFALGADLQYALDNVVPGLYAGGGLNMNFLSYEYEFNYGFGTTSVDDSESKFGISPLVGYKFDLGNFAAFAEGRYNMIDSFDNLQINFGASFSLN